MNNERPHVRIQFRYNVDTGEVEDFIIDDNAPTAPEGYHDDVAEAISGLFSRDAAIEDAGPAPLRDAGHYEVGDTRTGGGQEEKKTEDSVGE